MENLIYGIVKDYTSECPIKRKKLVETIQRIRKTDARWIREIISEKLPEIGEAGSGYYVKRTTKDCIEHEKSLKARIKKLQNRLKRCQEVRKDIQHGKKRR